MRFFDWKVVCKNYFYLQDRRKTIFDHSNALAKSVNGRIIFEESLLNEVTDLMFLLVHSKALPWHICSQYILGCKSCWGTRSSSWRIWGFLLGASRRSFNCGKLSTFEDLFDTRSRRNKQKPCIHLWSGWSFQ